MRASRSGAPRSIQGLSGIGALLACAALLAGCAERNQGTAAAQAESDRPALAGPDFDRFGEYWWQGKAEITSYDLEQARYGEVHPGHAVLIFVTEDFSRAKQVKLDDPASAGGDEVNVLKLNATRNFNTGIYPYSMMSSVFTPVKRAESPRTLKVTTTSQEWCGHTFTQLNRRGGGYDLQAYSYFESEGDQTLALPDVLLEDEIWNTIRLNPEDLPLGDLRVLPGTIYQRFAHSSWEPRPARATLEPHATEPDQRVYRLEYPEAGRTLAIEFRAEFPFEIEAWEESRRSGFGSRARTLTTRAEKRERILLDYWSKNARADVAYRTQLGLD